jgi:hypothetical protein
VKVFFGLTLRAGDAGPALMGQAVLTSHVLDGNFYRAHGLWFESRSAQEFQQPVTNAQAISKFSAVTGVSRTSQTGLSIAIPYLVAGITEETLIQGVISNYYFPILAGSLEVEVGDELISRTTFDDVVSRYADNAAGAIPFTFVRQVSEASGKPLVVATKAIGKEQLDSDILTEEQVAVLKKAYAANELVHVRVPVRLEDRAGVIKSSNIDLFLQNIGETEKPFALFARGPIILPGERKWFGGCMARGALVANDPDVAALLGDAENPAHTAWNPQAEKLNARWQHGARTLSAIRHALKQLYTLVADQLEQTQQDALIDFFAIADQAKSSSGKQPKSPKPKPEIAPREKAISIRGRKGGFEIVAGPGAKSWTFPRNIRVRVAYDIIGADPFKRHSKFDFDLENGTEIDFDSIESSVSILKPNVMKITVTSPDFMVEATGFDPRRDLIVDARAV